MRRGSANSYAAIKKLVWESQFKDWQDYAALELNLQESLAQTEDFKEGVRLIRREEDRNLLENKKILAPFFEV